MDTPLVSVICLCYNHERFVAEAIQSVLAQEYTNIEIIIVDDASTDGSVRVIEELIGRNPTTMTFLPLKKNHGNCSAFNIGWRMAKGEFVVDFATDDVMLPNRISAQVSFFSSGAHDCGVVFTDAVHIDANGATLTEHYAALRKKGLVSSVPSGDVYKDLIQTYFISAPTMLVRRNVFERLNGYDESLAYEDFDFWIRSAREFRYGFLNEVLTKVRISGGSMHTRQYARNDKQAYSTYLVCKKIRNLNRSEEEHRALAKRLRYEIRQCVFSDNRSEALLFFGLLREMNEVDPVTRGILILNSLGFTLSPLRRWYHRMRYS